MTQTHLSFIILLVSGWAFCAGAQPLPAATDFEWELLNPDRILFRDRVPVGEIQLDADAKSGFFGKRKKSTGETLSLWTEAAFVPGDTARFLAVSIETVLNEAPRGETILDANEISAFYKAVDYLLATSGNIATTERTDTRVQFRSKSGMVLLFRQSGKAQYFEMNFPPRGNRPEHATSMSRDHLSTLKDLLDLTLFELKRQGAAVETGSGLK